jgi:hypothetical protein
VVSEEPPAVIFRVAGCFSGVAVRSLPSIALKMQAGLSQTLVATYQIVEYRSPEVVISAALRTLGIMSEEITV